MERKIAIISDIHGNIEALRNVLQDIEENGIGMEDVYCLGDSVGYGTRPNEVIELLRERNIQSILGNHDQEVSFYQMKHKDAEIYNTQNITPFLWTVKNTKEDNKEYLRQLKEMKNIQVNGYAILLLHGSPYAITDYIHEEDIEKQELITKELKEDIILFGHTHIPYVKRVNSKIFINAGSVGRPKDGDAQACYCILKLHNSIEVEFVRVRYDIEKMAKEIELSELPDSYAMVLRNGLILGCIL